MWETLFTHTLALIGAITVFLIFLEALFSPIQFLSSYLKPFFQPAEVQPLLQKFGPWAAVTGSSDGIGKQYSMELARRGFNVVLISRNFDKLKAVADQIEKSYAVKTKIIVADFSKGREVYPHIEEELKEVPLGLLVNNVGINHEYPMPLCEVPIPTAWDIININVAAVTILTRMVLPGMVERGRGAVVNVSSASELQPIPLLSIYAATKAYVRSFTLAIQEEYSHKGITIQHLAPFFVSTKINSFSQRILDGNILIPDAEAYARQAVATLGRISSTTGYWSHGIQCFFTLLMPAWIRVVISKIIFKEFRREYFQMNAKAKIN